LSPFLKNIDIILIYFINIDPPENNKPIKIVKRYIIFDYNTFILKSKRFY